MSNRARAGLIVLAVAVVVVAFFALRPSDSSDKADEPAGKPADATPTAKPGETTEEPTATAESEPPPQHERVWSWSRWPWRSSRLSR